MFPDFLLVGSCISFLIREAQTLDLSVSKQEEEEGEEAERWVNSASEIQNSKHSFIRGYFFFLA